MKKTSINKIIAAIVCYVLLCIIPASVSGQIKARKGSLSSKKKTGKNDSQKTNSIKPNPINLGKIPGQLNKASDDEIIGVTSRGEDGITETVEQIMQRERENPPEKFNGIPKKKKEEVPRDRPEKKQNPLEEEMNRKFLAPTQVFSDSKFFLPQTLGTSIAGPDIASSGFVPPDSIGDVGPNQVLMHSNGRIRVYDKATGALGSLDVADSTFWNSVRNGAGVSDPHIEFDRLSGRWFLCMINTQAAPNRVMIAVSSGATITNTASFTFFQFTHDAVGATPNTDTGGFADYPTWGIDANAAYMGMNIFNAAGNAVVGTTVYVFNKANLLAGTLTVTPFRQIGAASGSGAGPWTPQAADNDDASFTSGYFVGADNASFSLLNVRRVSTPAGTPTLSGNLNVTVPTTTFPILQPHLGAATATRRLDALDDRIFAARIQKNEITGVSTLVAAHNIQVNTAGTGSSAGGRNGSRWYELGTLTATPALVQSGTLFDNAAANPNGFWIPSIAMSGQGHMAIASSSAGLARRAEIFASGRLRTDATGTLQAPTQVQASATNYNVEAADGQRWGDYSQTSVDPCDNQTFWTFQEYCDANNSWRMRAVQLLAPLPPSTVTPSPTGRAFGVASVNVTVTGVSVAGTEFFDNPSGFICNASCNTTGTGTCRMAASVTSSPLAFNRTPSAALTINSVTFNSPTQVTLNISTVGATPGTHTIQIRNPDGQATSFNFQVLVPTAATASLGGNIRNNANQPVSGVSVAILDTQSGESATVNTDANGQYVQPQMLVGRNYVVTPSRQGYVFEPANRLVSFDEQNLTTDFAATSNSVSQSVFNDFDGDGKTDSAIYRSSEQNWYILQSGNQTMKVENMGLTTDLLTPADFDGDGKTDIAMFRPSNGTWYIRNSSNGNLTTQQFGKSGDIPVAGNYDGDNPADLAVFRPKEGLWYIRQSTNSSMKTVSWGVSSDLPVPRDFDGDGKVDPTVYRPSEGRWYSLYSTTGNPNITQFGVATDKIAPGDYDGDGKTDIAVYRPSSGAWFILNSSNSLSEIKLFGVEQDNIVSGDYNGDGRTDISLYRPNNSMWYVRRSDGGFTAQKWGTTGDVPAVPSWLR